jgi:predicted GH43/DUF377 family glycosyl hydrolase
MAAVTQPRLITRRGLLVGAAALGAAWLAGVTVSRLGVGGSRPGGWRKDPSNPLLGGSFGSCFDASVLAGDAGYQMWFSWRPRGGIGYSTSADGVAWSAPVLALAPDPTSGWEDVVNRAGVVRRGDDYHMWYSGQAGSSSSIGYATSPDGVAWTKVGREPVLPPTQAWEGQAVMCPNVVWDEERAVWRMWYSGGEVPEPNAIGHAVSSDGAAWAKHAANPVFVPDGGDAWDHDRVTACDVHPTADGFLMFYTGFRDVDHAQIGIARSSDGLTGWQRHSLNPILRPGGTGAWDAAAVYKPSVVHQPGQWLLWYNGRHTLVEGIGLARHAGDDLGF